LNDSIPGGAGKTPEKY